MIPSSLPLTQVVSAQVTETILNLVYFVVGLAVGLFSLWQNQKYFQAQQQDKFNQIAAELQQIRDNVASIAHTTSERASSREDRLLTLVTQQLAIENTQEEAISDIRQVVIQELERSGISDAVQKTRNLEERVSRIVTDSTGRVAEISRAINLGSLEEQEATVRSAQVMLRLLNAFGDKLFTEEDLRSVLPYSKREILEAVRSLREKGVLLLAKNESGKYVYKLAMDKRPDDKNSSQ